MLIKLIRSKETGTPICLWDEVNNVRVCTFNSSNTGIEPAAVLLETAVNAAAAAQQRIGELEKALEADNRMFAMLADLLKDGPHVGKTGFVTEQIALNVTALRHPERT